MKRGEKQTRKSGTFFWTNDITVFPMICAQARKSHLSHRTLNGDSLTFVTSNSYVVNIEYLHFWVREKAFWSINSPTRSWRTLTNSAITKTWVSSMSWMMNFFPKAFDSSKYSRNCFMAGSLQKETHDNDTLCCQITPEQLELGMQDF